MALKALIQFPIFAPPNHHHRRPATEVRFSRWNNVNAEKFIRHQRTQKEIEDEIRFHKRFNSSQNIAHIYDANTSTTTTTNTTAETFKSTGTPSSPSKPSIPGKASKYSKNHKIPKSSHPAFRPILRPTVVPNEAQEVDTYVKTSENGVSYEFPEAPFPYQYSYTETPKVKPIKLREPPIAPFGPSTMPRPWTGRKPLPPSKKKLEFDSFQLPPPHKKGVRPVQAPGPFLPGSGPKYVQSREEILGEPLTKEEIQELVKGCMKSQRQLNMGRDGLTHNMLDNIHAHWKRRRVCKVKCKGVSTVDMDNVSQKLEEKTGGKVICSKGGVIYLFRGRNYNYKTRPRFPLMLWKPVTPVYPRLIQRVPEGLTLEEATEMRNKGRKLTPICKLGKNGVYCDLVKNVKEAFEACELVRISCQGMNGSDYRKIGAKLKDLVPCVLISFEREHILMWRGGDWKSSLSKLEDVPREAKKPTVDGAASIASPLEGQTVTASSVSNLSVNNPSLENLNTSTSPVGSEGVGLDGSNKLSKDGVEDLLSEVIDLPSMDSHASESPLSYEGFDDDDDSEGSYGCEMIVDGSGCDSDDTTMSVGSEPRMGSTGCIEIQSELLSVVPHTRNNVSENLNNLSELVSLSSPWTQGVVLLWKQAVEGGRAVVLDNSSLDADIVYRKATTLAQSAPPGPAFRHISKNVTVQKWEKQELRDSEPLTVSEERGTERRKSSNNQRIKGFKEDYAVPHGGLRIDELAKLLAS